MTEPSPSIQAEAERLLTLLPIEPGDEMVEARATRLVNEYVIFKRPAVAAALQAKQDEIDRLRELFDGAMDFCPHPDDAHPNDRSEIEALRQARTALNPTPASTGAKHDGGAGEHE